MGLHLNGQDPHELTVENRLNSLIAAMDRNRRINDRNLASNRRTTRFTIAISVISAAIALMSLILMIVFNIVN